MKTKKRYRSNKSQGDSFAPTRQGVILFAVLVCISVVLALAMSAITTSLKHRRQMRTDLQMLQTEIMLDAAMESAPFKKWQEKNKARGEDQPLEPFKLELDLGLRKKTSVIAWVNSKRDAIQLTVTIGGFKKQFGTTRRSKLIKLAQTNEKN